MTTTTLMNKTYPSYNQNQLKILCDKLCDRIEDLCEVLGLTELKNNGKMLVGPCPIHNGDNITAFNLYPDGESYRGNWKCRTHNCDKIFKPSIIGFVRGVLSNKKYSWQNNNDTTATFNETIKFIENFLGQNTQDIKISNSDLEKKNFSIFIKHITNNKNNDTTRISRHSIKKSLIIPSEYFIDRGFDPKIIEKYDVGLCDKPEKEMYNRAVAPIYDMDYRFMVGCTGRSIFGKCQHCSTFHNPRNPCPQPDEKWKYSKWKHNYQLKSQDHLYNLWFAKEHILKSTKVILVESPGNVWKLEENGIHNSVALFGSNLSDKQKILLDGSGAMTIINIMDSDDAGQKAVEIIENKCKNTYNILNIKISKPDIAEMTNKEIHEQIGVYL